jgi:N-acetylmuramoyl-L-alanine amidase
MLARVGYAIERTEQADQQTRNVMAAFQMHYRPQRFDGAPDAETAAILDVLTSTP